VTTLDYANTMLDIYLDDDWQPQAIRHYLELRLSERVRMDRERELKEILEDDRKRCNKSIRAN
jgi:hypothetical protein